MKFYTEGTKCWDCGEPLSTSPKQEILQCDGPAAVHLSCQEHNRGYVATLEPSPHRGMVNSIDIYLDIDGCRRVTEDVLRKTLRVLSDEEKVQLLSELNVMIERFRFKALR